MPPEPTPPHLEQTPREIGTENDKRRNLFLTLFLLLLTFSCTFCASQIALWRLDQDSIEASVRALTQADYSANPALALAPLDEKIKAEAAWDEALLTTSHTPASQGLPVALLPNPLPTVTLAPFIPPTVTATPILNENADEFTGSPPPEPRLPSPEAPLPGSTATPMPALPLPTATAAQPSPTVPPSPSPPMPPSPTPMRPPPTTLPPPTSKPPTSKPPTLPPPTVTQTPLPPTATQTPVSPTATPTTTPTPTPTPLPAIAFSRGNYNVGEGVGNAVITITLSAPSGQIITTSYATSDISSATESEDYVAVDNMLTFLPGQTILTFTITITDDLLTNEQHEHLQLSLQNPVNATPGTPYSSRLTIADNDGQPTAFFSSPTYTVTEDAGPVPVTVNLSAPSALPITVTYRSADMTAVAPDDYTKVNNSLTFSPYQTGLNFNIESAIDILDEPDETLALSLSNPVNTTLGSPNRATVTISDDDVAPGDCAGAYLPDEPDIGDPDGDIIKIGCEVGLIVDLGSSITVTGLSSDTEPELIFYEWDSGGIGGIYMDLVAIFVGQSPAGPWHKVFEWGDGIDDTNTNLMKGTPSYPDTGVGADNTVISSPPLVEAAGLKTGITIDVDNLSVGPAVPEGSYRYVRIYAPPPTSPQNTDGPDVDAVKPLP